jgi:RimJ/RimL family protein N-acetyltransferase
MLFDWANDDEARAMAFSPEPIIWAEHEQWFEKTLKDSKAQIYIALDEENVPVGQIRFVVVSENDAEIDVHSRPGLRGKGIGTQIISLGTEMFFKEAEVETIHALVKLENERSRRAFQKAGFHETDKSSIDGRPCFHMVKMRALFSQ